MKQINTILLLLLGGGVIVILLLIRPPGEEVASTQEAPPREFEIGGRFSEVCPPKVLPTVEQVYLYYAEQDIGEALQQHFYQVGDPDGESTVKIENRAFCLFQIGDKVFGMLNPNYEGPSGESAKLALETWRKDREIPRKSICQIFWVDTTNPCKEGPEIPDKEGDRTFA